LSAGPQCIDESTGSRQSKVTAGVVVAVIVANTLGIVLETEAGVVAALPPGFFFWLDAVCTVVFTLELLARAYTTESWSAWRRDFLNFVDVVAIVPFYAELAITAWGEQTVVGAAVLGALGVFRLLRVVRLIKLSRFLKAAQHFVEVLSRASKSLGVSAFFACLAAIVVAFLVYTFEEAGGTPESVQGSDALESAPLSLFWVMTTVTSVGYGNVTPTMALSRVVAGMAAIFGLVIVSLSVNIITTHFQALIKEEELMDEIRARRERGMDTALEFGLDGAESVDFVLELSRDERRAAEAGLAPPGDGGDGGGWAGYPTARERASRLRRLRSCDDFVQAAARQARGEVGDEAWAEWWSSAVPAYDPVAAAVTGLVDEDDGEEDEEDDCGMEGGVPSAGGFGASLGMEWPEGDGGAAAAAAAAAGRSGDEDDSGVPGEVGTGSAGTGSAGARARGMGRPASSVSLTSRERRPLSAAHPGSAGSAGFAGVRGQGSPSGAPPPGARHPSPASTGRSSSGRARAQRSRRHLAVDVDVDDLLARPDAAGRKAARSAPRRVVRAHKVPAAPGSAASGSSRSLTRTGSASRRGRAAEASAAARPVLGAGAGAVGSVVTALPPALPTSARGAAELGLRQGGPRRLSAADFSADPAAALASVPSLAPATVRRARAARRSSLHVGERLRREADREAEAARRRDARGRLAERAVRMRAVAGMADKLLAEARRGGSLDGAAELAEALAAERDVVVDVTRRASLAHGGEPAEGAGGAAPGGGRARAAAARRRHALADQLRDPTALKRMRERCLRESRQAMVAVRVIDEEDARAQAASHPDHRLSALERAELGLLTMRSSSRETSAGRAAGGGSSPDSTARGRSAGAASHASGAGGFAVSSGLPPGPGSPPPSSSARASAGSGEAGLQSSGARVPFGGSAGDSLLLGSGESLSVGASFGRATQAGAVVPFRGSSSALLASPETRGGRATVAEPAGAAGARADLASGRSGSGSVPSAAGTAGGAGGGGPATAASASRRHSGGAPGLRPPDGGRAGATLPPLQLRPGGGPTSFRRGSTGGYRGRAGSLRVTADDPSSPVEPRGFARTSTGAGTGGRWGGGAGDGGGPVAPMTSAEADRLTRTAARVAVSRATAAASAALGAPLLGGGPGSRGGGAGGRRSSAAGALDGVTGGPMMRARMRRGRRASDAVGRPSDASSAFGTTMSSAGSLSRAASSSGSAGPAGSGRGRRGPGDGSLGPAGFGVGPSPRLPSVRRATGDATATTSADVGAEDRDVTDTGPRRAGSGGFAGIEAGDGSVLGGPGGGQSREQSRSARRASTRRRSVDTAERASEILALAGVVVPGVVVPGVVVPLREGGGGDGGATHRQPVSVSAVAVSRAVSATGGDADTDGLPPALAGFLARSTQSSTPTAGSRPAEPAPDAVGIDAGGGSAGAGAPGVRAPPLGSQPRGAVDSGRSLVDRSDAAFASGRSVLSLAAARAAGAGAATPVSRAGRGASAASTATLHPGRPGPWGAGTGSLGAPAAPAESLMSSVMQRPAEPAVGGGLPASTGSRGRQREGGGPMLGPGSFGLLSTVNESNTSLADGSARPGDPSHAAKALLLSAPGGPAAGAAAGRPAKPPVVMRRAAESRGSASSLLPRRRSGRADGGPRGGSSGGGAAGPRSLAQSAADEARSAAGSVGRSMRRDWLRKLVSDNQLMVVVSPDFRVCASLSLRALASLVKEVDTSKRELVRALAEHGADDAETAVCFALIAAFEERIGQKLQSLTEYLSTSIVSIGRKMDVPLPTQHLAELGRSMNANIARV